MAFVSFLLRRLGLSVVVFVGVLLLTFIVSRIIPSNPGALYAGARPRPEQVAAIEKKLGLDKPLSEQFHIYVHDLLGGDLGESYHSRRSINADLSIFLPATLELVIAAVLIALVIGIPVGVLAGAYPRGVFDYATRFVAIAGVSVPSFWLALIAQSVFFSQLGWLPLGSRISRDATLFYPIAAQTGFYLIDAAISANWKAWFDALHHLILPALVLSAYPLGVTIRMTQASMLEALSEAYVTAARAAGLPRRVILFKLALKNAIMPALTVVGLSFAYSITGAFLVETIFSWPGVGKYVTEAVLNVDFPVIIAVTLVVTIFYILVNLLVDVIQAFLDPRLRLV
ncbi:MAG: ABC transporter permease [Chloroflexota bacterium]|nr:ABC transporter permease [Chloroflexota bacterium]MDE2911114.1 ABC transporter permease [Chloroflexota bacterium]